MEVPRDQISIQFGVAFERAASLGNITEMKTCIIDKMGRDGDGANGSVDIVDDTRGY